MEEKNQIYHEHFINTDIETMQYEVPTILIKILKKNMKMV